MLEEYLPVKRLPRPVGVLYTLLVVCLTFVIFRSETFGQAFFMLSRWSSASFRGGGGLVRTAPADAAFRRHRPGCRRRFDPGRPGAPAQAADEAPCRQKAASCAGYVARARAYSLKPAAAVGRRVQPVHLLQVLGGGNSHGRKRPEPAFRRFQAASSRAGGLQRPGPCGAGHPLRGMLWASTESTTENRTLARAAELGRGRLSPT